MGEAGESGRTGLCDLSNPGVDIGKWREKGVVGKCGKRELVEYGEERKPDAYLL